jgi:hypothetical protein
LAFEKDPNEIGVLWQKHGKKGAYMTGEIEGIGPVVVFAISSTNPKAPNWRVLKSKPVERSHPADKINPDWDKAEPIEGDDIGF